MAYLDPSSWPHSQCQAWVLSNGLTLRANQKMVGYSHDTLTTVAQWVDLGGLLVNHSWVTTLLQERR